MRVKMYLIIALFFCLLLLEFSVDAIGIGDGGISSTIPNNLDLKTPASPTAATSTDTSSGGPSVTSNDFSFYQFTYSDGSATIYCLGSDGYTTEGIIKFYPDGTTPVPTAQIEVDQEQASKIYPLLYYPISKFNDVINIMRYSNSSLSVYVNVGSMDSGIRASAVQTGPHGAPRSNPYA